MPAVAILGPRQAGKTTLALQIADKQPSLYLDLQLESDRVRLDDPAPYLYLKVFKGAPGQADNSG